jgi:alpha-tubulin suppressor-like RCC1 family protein
LGYGEYGKLGHGNEVSISKPKHVISLIGKKVVDVNCGSTHTAVVTSEGGLYTWYVNDRRHNIDFDFLYQVAFKN